MSRVKKLQQRHLSGLPEVLLGEPVHSETTRATRSDREVRRNAEQHASLRASFWDSSRTESCSAAAKRTFRATEMPSYVLGRRKFQNAADPETPQEAADAEELFQAAELRRNVVAPESKSEDEPGQAKRGSGWRGHRPPLSQVEEKQRGSFLMEPVSAHRVGVLQNAGGCLTTRSCQNFERNSARTSPYCSAPHVRKSQRVKSRSGGAPGKNV